MTIQAKDFANGGIFQMEVERNDATATRFTHVLGDGVFYFDTPSFRAREGDVVPFKDTTVTMSPPGSTSPTIRRARSWAGTAHRSPLEFRSQGV